MMPPYPAPDFLAGLAVLVTAAAGLYLPILLAASFRGLYRWLTSRKQTR